MTKTLRDSGPAVAVVGGQRLELLDKARVYACGITPYDVTHLGHAATFVWLDTLARSLRHLGVQSEMCRNITDVDDVLHVAASRAGTPSDAFAAVQQFQFDQDMAALGVRRPEHEPRSHRYVEQVIRLAAGLVDAGVAYAAHGSVYFRGVGTAERAGLPAAEAVALSGSFGGRPDDPGKDDPLDVAVWQAAEPGHPVWQSPWGPGRPGWHAECAAMAMSVFGPAVDIHGGGADLRFPHHAYHGAMAEAFTGVRPYARAWFHVGMVTVDGAKMAKSTGNLVLVDQLVASHPAPAVRLMILDRAWSESWDYEPSLLAKAAARLEELYAAAGRGGAEGAPAEAELRRLLADDLNVPAALDLAAEEGGPCARSLATVLGLVF